MATRRYFYAIEWAGTPGALYDDGYPFGSVFRFARQAARDAWVAGSPPPDLPGYREAYNGEAARRFTTFYEIDGDGELVLADADGTLVTFG